MYAKEEFALTKVPVSSGVTEDATGGADRADCRGADNAPFPGGAWATLPTYLTPSYKVAGSAAVRGAKSYRCWGTQTVSAYPISEVGVYGRCALANTGSAADWKADDKKALAAITAAATARTTAAKVQVAALKCLNDAAKHSTREQRTKGVNKYASLAAERRAKARACPANKACEVAAKRANNLMDLTMLAACPVNAMCLRRAARYQSTVTATTLKKQCPLLEHAAALLADERALQ